MALGYFRHPRGGGRFSSKQSAFFFYVKQQNLRNKALIVDREDWKTDLLSFLARTPSQALVAKFEDEIIY